MGLTEKEKKNFLEDCYSWPNGMGNWYFNLENHLEGWSVYRLTPSECLEFG